MLKLYRVSYHLTHPLLTGRSISLWLLMRSRSTNRVNVAHRPRRGVLSVLWQDTNSVTPGATLVNFSISVQQVLVWRPDVGRSFCGGSLS
jgi:hypothetical protein